jgi:hypothetical protein
LINETFWLQDRRNRFVDKFSVVPVDPATGICLTLGLDNESFICHTIEGAVDAGGICG